MNPYIFDASAYPSSSTTLPGTILIHEQAHSGFDAPGYDIGEGRSYGIEVVLLAQRSVGASGASRLNYVAQLWHEDVKVQAYTIDKRSFMETVVIAQRLLTEAHDSSSSPEQAKTAQEALASLILGSNYTGPKEGSDYLENVRASVDAAYGQWGPSPEFQASYQAAVNALDITDDLKQKLLSQEGN